MPGYCLTCARTQVVVPIPEETWVARKQEGVTEVDRRDCHVAGLLALSVALFLLGSRSTTRRTQTTRPVVRSSPSPTPSPTPTENANQQANVNSTPGPDELAAREKLAQRNMPYDEAAFTRVVEDGDTDAVDLYLAAGMNGVKDANGRNCLILLLQEVVIHSVSC